MRADLIPGIVILLQKQWRGALCRMRYRKMKAALTIMSIYRRYKLRSYVTQLAFTLRFGYNLIFSMDGKTKRILPIQLLYYLLFHGLICPQINYFLTFKG